LDAVLSLPLCDAELIYASALAGEVASKDLANPDRAREYFAPLRRLRPGRALTGGIRAAKVPRSRSAGRVTPST
ncbi:MAG: hypothetical protein AAB113_01670, partial [Candidatus Eisenbacteria bacterium]